MDVSNHHILFRAVAFSGTRLIIAVSSKKKNVRGACSSVISFSRELSVDQAAMCENPSVWLEIKTFFFPPLCILLPLSFPCDYFVCLSLLLSLSPSNECVWAGVLVQQVLSVCVRFQKHKEQLTCCRTS